ncbi:hypothetical protein J437_LFUL004628 [Ladona fulva]|uniref:Uncharacterized protein n=1 Tax=Ladona fulva TaxID=123851 RepID=A0A8K0NX33_LADFU|nr:hypothetical protein J437_LFUL004628 [Ladona fulva]
MAENSNGSEFLVPVGSLGFSVMVYSSTALLTVALFALRRNVSAFGNAELGGPRPYKIASSIFLLFLWVVYVFLSSLQTYGYIGDVF